MLFSVIITNLNPAKDYTTCLLRPNLLKNSFDLENLLKYLGQINNDLKGISIYGMLVIYCSLIDHSKYSGLK